MSVITQTAEKFFSAGHRDADPGRNRVNNPGGQFLLSLEVQFLMSFDTCGRPEAMAAVERRLADRQTARERSV